MPIPVRCACGKALNAPDALAGKKAKCPGCGAVLSIPAAQGAPAQPAEKPAAPGPKPATPPAKPTPAQIKPAPSKAVPKPTPLSQAKTEIKPAAKGSGTFQAPESEGKDLHAYSACPTCNKFVSKKDAICVQCGTHLLTGKKLSTVMSSEPTGPARQVAVTCLLLNALVFFLPGIGTLVGGGRRMRTQGMMQLLLGLGGVVLANPVYPDLPATLDEMWGMGIAARIAGALLVLGGWIWAILAGLKILKNAKPAA
jgi:hypothetical protein